MANITQPNRTDKGNESYSFRCADAGFTGCSWEAKGSSPDEVLRKAEQHGREQHNLTSIDDETRDKVRSKIRHAACYELRRIPIQAMLYSGLERSDIFIC